MNQNVVSTELLKKIINTQAILAEANFDTQAFMQLVVDEMQSLTPATGAVVELVEGEEMVYQAVTGTVSEHLGLRLKKRKSISGLCVALKEVLCANDTEKDSRVDITACRKVAARSLVVAPLIYSGKPIGVLKIVSNKAYAFNEIHIQTLQIMAGFIASGLNHQLLYKTKEKLLRERIDAIKKLKIIQKRLDHLAHHDVLTGLPNRGMFLEQLKNAFAIAKQHQTLLALMYLDIDHFKMINDSLGHNTGDTLLKAFSKRLIRCVRQTDLVVRLGGDEFILLLRNLKHQDDAVIVAQKILHAMSTKFKLKNKLLSISTSIGIAFYQGENIQTSELIKHADEALYEAKKEGRNKFIIADKKKKQA